MALAIGVIGYGALGRSVHRILATLPGCRVAAILTPKPVQDLQGTPSVQNLAEFLRAGHDTVIECAGQAALKEYANAVLESGADLVAASVGVLVDDQFRASVLRSAALGGSAVRIPSGAMVGIDGIAAARHVGVDRVTYRGTMAPHALKNFESGDAITQRTLVYEGTAREAVSRFPKNANLTGTIALAGIGFDKTRVELFLDPGITANIHELEASGSFGEFRVKVVGNRISDASPSSRIVAGSLTQAAIGSSFTRLFEPPALQPGNAQHT